MKRDDEDPKVSTPPTSTQAAPSAFNLPFLAQLGAMLVTGVLAYAALAAQGTSNAREIEVLVEQMGALQREVRALQISEARGEERFAQILTIVSRTDARLERLEQQSRGATP